MKRTVLCLIIQLLIASLMVNEIFSDGLPTTTPEKVGLSSERLERINKVIQNYVDTNRISGAVTLVARHGKTAHIKATGLMDIESGKPMQTNAIFRIASMTKAFTSVAAMMLYEEGCFLLTDPVSEYIPEFKDLKVLVPAPESYEHSAAAGYAIVPAKREMTIRHLLNHTSGLTSTLWQRPYINDMYKNNLGGETTIGEMVRKLGKLPLYNHPGDAFEYGESTNVLGYLVEVVSGMTLAEFIDIRICEPLGLDDTFFYVPDDKLDRIATLYRPKPEEGLEPANKGYRGSQTRFSGTGGLFSTINDYARFLQMLLNGGELDGVRILGRKTIELMTTNSIGDLYSTWPQLHGDKFGLGFGIRTERGRFDDIESIGTYSWGGIFNTIFYVDPKEDMICIFMNQLFPQDHLTIRRQFRVLAFQAIVD
ncbi:MAG: beta-lactamase family protein [Candidatus Latescibacteria bacterium]|nr:beta-lactamase family protein [Candidatus Latescibacterota bacterium]